jgi:type II secretory pathway pseudopilin PulG
MVMGGLAMPRPGAAGFTYLSLMMAVLVMGVALAGLGEGWRAAGQREKEAQLLFAGHQMRNALIQYYLHSPQAAVRHPASLQELLEDRRLSGMRRYLRRIEVDPLTGKAEWGLVRDAQGRIYGVHSLSGARPLKQANFRRADSSFAGAARYSDWVFMFAPGQMAIVP